MKLKIKPHYSGDLSRKFWELVNSLPDADQQEMYFAGCLLQEMEGRILDMLEYYINEPTANNRNNDNN